MKRPVKLTLVAAVVIALAMQSPLATAIPSQVSGRPASLDPALASRLALLAPGETLAVFARVTGQADLSVVRERDRRGRAKHVQSTLRDHATRRQVGVKAVLSRLTARHQVSTVQTWWIDNAVSFTGTADAIRTVAARTDVASISLDEAPIKPLSFRTGAPAASPAANITQIGAPTLWSRGITGASVVVADLDTGVDATQPDLAGSWRGGSDSWFDPYGQHSTPTDLDGHGTWTTSVMVGRDGSGQAVGVAPDARWIAARVFDDSGRATLSGVHAALQWALDPSGNPAAPNPPQVLNASWSSASSTCSSEFQPDLAALRTAGIVPVFAAGNSGPATNSGSSPATLPEALAVGSVDSNDLIDTSSSRGPSSCAGRGHYPDLVAPGVDIPVDDLYGGSWIASGTSLAAPHVAGALALLLSAHPGLTADQQQAALTGGAVDLGAAGVDDVYGAGRLDVVAAEARLGPAVPPGPITSSVTVSPSPAGGSVVPTVGAVLTAATGGAAPATARAAVDGGTPFALTVSTISGTTSAAGSVPSSLPDGSHTVAVSAADASGTWGAASSTSFVIDRSAPVVTAVSASPSPTAGAANVTVVASASDATTGVLSAQAWIDSATPVAMTVTSGSGGAVSLRAVLPVSGLALGGHTVSVRAGDGASNVATATASFTVSAAPITSFADGFESGGITAWASSGGAGLAVSTTAALAGRYGLGVTATRTGGYVRANVPGTSGPVNVRVLFDPRAMVTGSAVVPVLIERTSAGVWSTIEYHRTGTTSQVRVTGRTSAGVVKVGGWVTIASTGASVLEIDGQPGSGTLTFYVANKAWTALTGLSTSSPSVVDVGIVGAQPTSVVGSVRLDAVVVNRTTHIGTSTAGL